MAYLSPEGQDQQQNAAAPASGGAPNATPAPTQTGATAPGAKTASPDTASSTAPGTAATNVNQYLSANAPQTQQYANGVSSGLNNQYGQIQSDVNSAANNFQGQINSGYTPEDTSVVNNAAANPTAFVTDPNNVSAFQAQENDTYIGPNQFETASPYTGLTNEIAQGQNAAAPWQSFSGTAGEFGNLGDTTLGDQNLDATLFASTPGVNSQISNAAGQFSTLPAYLTQTGTTLDTNAANAATNANAAAANVSNIFNPIDTAFNSNLTNETSAADAANVTAQQTATAQQAQDNAAIQAAFNKFQSGVPISNSGSNADLFTALGSKAPGAGIQLNSTPETAAQVANPQEYAEATALSQLMGSNYANPLAGATSTPYSAFMSTPSILQQNAPLLDPIDTYIQQYLENQGLGQDISGFTTTTPTGGSDSTQNTPWLTPPTPVGAGEFASGSPTDAVNSRADAYNLAEEYMQMLAGLQPDLYATPGQNTPTSSGTPTAHPIIVPA